MKPLPLLVLLAALLPLACGPDTGSARVIEEGLEDEPVELGPDRVVEEPVAPPPRTITSLPKLVRDQGITVELMNPHLATERAPDVYRVKLVTTKGDILIECVRDWAPLGADRFYNLVKLDFFRDVYFHRVIDGFIAQFGVHPETLVSGVWLDARLRDEVPKQSNRRGYLSFSKYNQKPHSRTTEVFINLRDNPELDRQMAAPFGRVISGLRVADQLYSGYGTGFTSRLLRNEGNEGARGLYTKADRIRYAELVPLDPNKTE